MICPFCNHQHDNEGDHYGCPNCNGEVMPKSKAHLMRKLRKERKEQGYVQFRRDVKPKLAKQLEALCDDNPHLCASSRREK